jgi:integrase
VIQQILRHKSPNTTTRYLRKLGLDAENVRSALEEIKRSDSVEIIPLKGKESK